MLVAALRLPILPIDESRRANTDCLIGLAHKERLAVWLGE
jgi:hypothetical protein